MEFTKDGRAWRIGTLADVGPLAGYTDMSHTIAAAIPLVFEAYATFHRSDGADAHAHERAVVETLVANTAAQPWWLGFLETGAHDVVFPHAPRTVLYWDWPYVLVEAGPEQALTWREGHMRGDGSLPDL